MLTVVHATTDEHVQVARELFWEYLQWVNDMLTREFAITLDVAAILDENMRTLDQFAPPSGRLLIAHASARPAGVACLKRLSTDTGEVKRMYVRPEFRRSGVGQALLTEVILAARAIGYQRLRLDSARFMHPAHALYHALGFHEIAPYPESEVPAEFHEHWVFMQKVLE